VELRSSDAASHVDSVRVATLQGTGFVVRARHYVLAAGGIENPRLLLAANGCRGPGMGNDRDLVGRFFMEHPHVAAGDVRLAEPRPLRLYRGVVARGVEVAGGLALPDPVLRRERLGNHGALLRPFGSLAAAGRLLHWPLGRRPEQPGRDLRLAARGFDEVAQGLGARLVGRQAPGTRRYALKLRAEQLPNPESRVTLGERRDPLGVPVARLDWRLTEADWKGMRRVAALFAAAWEGAGLGRYRQPREAEMTLFGGGNHHMGTTRMSATPARGVVDADCRVHGVDNLFVAGSSVFPTCGYANPTLTILKLALRLADHLRQHHL
jgi:choline dehydrogenase-like flavoprotein